jgi:hypothetical protein
MSPALPTSAGRPSKLIIIALAGSSNGYVFFDSKNRDAASKARLFEKEHAQAVRSYMEFPPGWPLPRNGIFYKTNSSGPVLRLVLQPAVADPASFRFSVGARGLLRGLVSLWETPQPDGAARFLRLVTTRREDLSELLSACLPFIDSCALCLEVDLSLDLSLDQPAP